MRYLNTVKGGNILDRKKRIREIMYYMFFGLLTTILNILVFYVFDSILNWQYLWANAISLIVSILFAYVTSKTIVFKTKTENLVSLVQEILRFIAYRSLAGVFDMFSMWLLVEFLIIDTNISKLLTQVIIGISNYIFSNFIIFVDN